MPIKIHDLVQTCGACPSQWEARTHEGEWVYIRYRWGVLSLGIGPDLNAAIDGGAFRGTPYYKPGAGRTLFEEQIGDDLDGVLTTFAMLEVLKEHIALGAPHD